MPDPDPAHLRLRVCAILCRDVAERAVLAYLLGMLTAILAA